MPLRRRSQEARHGPACRRPTRTCWHRCSATGRASMPTASRSGSRSRRASLRCPPQSASACKSVWPSGRACHPPSAARHACSFKRPSSSAPKTDRHAGTPTARCPKRHVANWPSAPNRLSPWRLTAATNHPQRCVATRPKRQAWRKSATSFAVARAGRAKRSHPPWCKLNPARPRIW